MDNGTAPARRYEYVHAMGKKNIKQWPMSSFPPGVLNSCSFIDSGLAVGQKQNNPYDHSGKK